MTDHATKTYDRDDAERDINSLYGCPGAKYESDTGAEILHDALRQFGLSVFSDEFMIYLGRKHIQEDDEMGRRAEADYRRSLRTA